MALRPFPDGSELSEAAETTAFAARLGHKFARKELLVRALTHGSRASNGLADYQRLEFLGDRVLGLVIAQALFEDDRGAREGQLAPRLNALVRKETCAEIAERIDLGAALRLGRSEALSGGRRKIAILGDAMEAVLAAVYLDSGFDAARGVILRHWGGLIAEVDTRAADAKSDLQEWAQGRGMALPRYVDMSRTGPDHAPVFTVRVELENNLFSEASAPSKRAAQHLAAQQLLGELDKS